MKKKTILSLFGVALCSMGATMQAQTYKLTDMTEAEFEAGSNTHFRFDQYRFASETYSPFTIFTDSGRVNYFDRYWPERFQEIPAGESVMAVAAERDYFMPLKPAWTAKKTNLSSGRDGNNPLSFLYVSRIDENTYETYPTLRGQAAISFIVPVEGYYKITAKVERMDQNANGALNNLVAKFRFRQQGSTVLPPSSSLGMDVAYGVDPEPMDTYTALGGPDYSGAQCTYKKTPPVTNVFYVHVKSGDMITAESDMSHLYGLSMFTDSTTYWARDVWGRTRWTQFDAEVVTKEIAEASGRFVDPYSDNEGYIDLFINLVQECSDFAGNTQAGVNVGEFDPVDIDAFWAVLEEYAEASQDPNLLGFAAKTYYERLSVEFEAFKAKAFTVDYQLPENRWLFQIPETSALYPDFEKQFLPKDDPEKAANSPWDFKTYTVASGIYNKWENYGTGSRNGEIPSFYNKANDYLYIGKNGNVHPTPAVSPAITFTASKDGLYYASTQVQRNKGNANRNYMYTRYRFIKGGIEDGVTSVPKENYMFADAYGLNTDNRPVSRDFYVSLKAGDVITFEEDCYTAGSNGSAGTDWEKLMVLMIPAEKADSTINANKDLYYDPYAKATDFVKMDSVLNAVETFLESVAGKIKDEPQVGEYPEAAKWEIDDAVMAAQELRDNEETTQVELNAGVLALSTAFGKFQASLTTRYEDKETFESGAYYIEKDGLYLTVDSFFVNGNKTVPAMYAHFAPILAPLEKNNQVFNVQFNEAYPDPLRFTITTCLKNETWEDDGAYHITEKGELREGDTPTAQSNVSDNHLWRNHSLLYNGDKWCIFNVRNNWSIVFTDDLNAYPTLPTTKEYLYRFVKFGTPGVGVENVNPDAKAEINVFGLGQGQIVLSIGSAEAVTAVIYNAAGQPVKEVSLSHSATSVTLPAGFYVVKATNGATAKVMVK